MAAREKTRDELDMQTLRELASLPANKFCFDCGQRGTTYVNVTIGAFVCSSCGGILRGLNPPHRVKSLTVCSFTEVEMDRIKSRGNEYCTHIWLGKLEGKPPSDVDLTSPDKRKDFMIAKYEEKRYYVDPREAIKKMKPRAPAVPASTSNSGSSSASSFTRSQTVISNKPPLQRSTAIPQTFSAGDISAAAAAELFKNSENDPFRDTKPGDGPNGASFADFSSAFGDSGTKCVSATSQAHTPSSSAPGSQTSSHKKPAPPPPDRYAALADLDHQLHQQQVVTEMPVTVPSMIVASTNSGAFWSGPPISSAVFVPPTHNPFSNTIPTWSAGAPNPFQPVPAQMVGSSNMLPHQSANGVPNVAKPSLPNGNTAPGYWPAASNTVWGGVPFQARQPDPFLANNAAVNDSYNPWAQSFGNNGVNPFENKSFAPGQPSSTSRTNAKNPFL